jgi:TolA-binding protein
MRRTSRPCVEVRAQLLADRAASPPAAAVAEHLSGCPDCRRIAARLESMLSARREAVTTTYGRDLEDRVLLALRPAIRAQIEQRQTPGWAAPMLAGHGWRWAAVGLAAATALAVLFIAPGHHRTDADDGTARIAQVIGKVAVLSLAGTWRDVPTQSGTMIEGETVETGVSSGARLELGGDRVALLGQSRLKLVSRRARVRLLLAKGELRAEVEPRQREGSSFEVSFVHGHLLVTGTAFRVRTDARVSEVAVERGRVQVQTLDGRSFALGAGESLRITGTEVVRDVPSQQTASPAQAGIDSSRANGDKLEPELGKTPNWAVVRGLRPRETGTLAELDNLVTEGQCGDAEAMIPQLPQALARAARSEATVRVADCYYAAGDIEAALRTYRRAAEKYSGTASGENASYELGRLLRQAGRVVEAQRAFRGYLARYPRGALAAEAQFSLCALAIDAQQPDEALQCLHRYRQRQPTSARLAETYLLEATVLRTAKRDCRGAIAAYDRYLQVGGEYAEQATRWRQWCRDQLGPE